MKTVLPALFILGALTPPSAAPRTVKFVKVSAGEFFACAVLSGPQSASPLYCWGDGRSAIFASGRASATPRAIRLPTAIARTPIVSLAVGATPFACFAISTGQVFCWGENDYGELGDASETPRTTPVQIRLPEPAVAVTAGENMACALARSGAAYCWGNNAEGQLGAGDLGKHGGPVRVQTHTRFTSLSAGAGGGACGLTQDAAVLCWGIPFGESETGDATVEDAQPSPPATLPAERYRALSVGNGFACVRNARGDVRCWGDANAGQLGAEVFGPASSLQVQLPNGEQSILISAGFQSACAVTTSQRVACWGRNDAGELGRMSEDASDRAPGFVVGDGRYLDVSTGGSLACAITVARSLECWGSFKRGSKELESGARRRSRPTLVAFQ
jgi:alpha-tubulin suppressor-like RCC1 family protein